MSIGREKSSNSIGSPRSSRNLPVESFSKGRPFLSTIGESKRPVLSVGNVLTSSLIRPTTKLPSSFVGNGEPSGPINKPLKLVG